MLRRINIAPTVLVTDAGRGSALAIIRSLGRKGCRVVAADSQARSLGFRSRYVAETWVYPAPEAAPAQYVAALRETVVERGVDLVIPVTDTALLPLSAARAELADLCKLALPEAEALHAVSDKLRTVELARELGVPVPETVLVATADEALAHAGSFDWPIVLKPMRSKVYRDGGQIDAFQVTYAGSPAELVERMRRFEGHTPVLLQEYYAGVGHGVELLMHEGRPLAAFQHERLRELPIHGGPSALRRSVPLDRAMYEHSRRLLEAVRWTGRRWSSSRWGAMGQS
jgi:predicted ATP-grasp superfamily ATP-dependent carboligase